MGSRTAVQKHTLAHTRTRTHTLTVDLKGLELNQVGTGLRHSS